MATKYAGATNTNWSAMTWLDGPSGSVTTAPGAGDVAELNNKVVRIDTDVTVATITNAMGGSFTCAYHTNNRTITANLVAAAGGGAFFFDQTSGNVILNGAITETASTYYSVGVSAAGAATVTLNTNLTAGAGISSYWLLFKTGSGALTINGNLLGNSNSRIAAYLDGSGAVTITGNLTGGSSSSAYGVRTTSNQTGAVVVNGNVSGGSGSASRGFYAQGGAVTITGNITGGSSSSAVGFYSDLGVAAITVNGNVSGGSADGCHGMQSNSARAFTITGDVTGGSHGSAYGFANNSGSVVVNGNVTPSSAAHGIYGIYGSAPVTVNGVVYGCAYGPGNTGATANLFGVYNTGDGVIKVRSAANGAYGSPPIHGPFFLLDDATNCTYVGRKSDLTTVTLTNPAGDSDQADPADVRLHTTYAHGNLEGTCAVPAAGSVALNVAVDNTTGTAVLTAANVTTAMAAGTVAGVSGDVTGKVLGGGSGTISGVGVRVSGILGSGASLCTVRVLVLGTPVPDADVWVTSDSEGSVVVAGTLQTNSSGTCSFLLDAGVTYYLWAQKDGINAIQGESFVAVAD